jgi:alcohol dehydrogenase
MQQLMLHGPGTVAWAEVSEPVMSDGEAAIVRPIAVATCDLDVAVLRGRLPLEGPYPFGHEAVAEVVEVGDLVRSVSVGDLVVVPFQISCGACGPCRPRPHRQLRSSPTPLRLRVGDDWWAPVGWSPRRPRARPPR